MNHIKPKKHLGQNFLQDEEVLVEIIAIADLKSSDVVLEVGPGTGVLTKELLARAGKVIAVEKDLNLVNLLQRNPELVSGSKSKDPETSSGLHIVHQDILRFHLDEHIQGSYKVVANIPYYLTSKLFQYFLEQKNKPKLMILMVQKEVGERVVAKPGELSLLGISVQIYADVEIASVEIPDQVRDGFGAKKKILIIPKTSFWPVPEVDSVVLKITPKDKYPQIKDKKLFFSILKQAFAGKRKQIKNTIKDPAVLEKAGVNPMLRPQDLSIEDWVRIYKVFV